MTTTQTHYLSDDQPKVHLITLLVINMLLAAIQPPEEMPMTKLEKKALILLTKTETNQVAILK